MFAKYGGEVEFYLIYIREAHPNEEKPQPKEYGERLALAKQMCDELKLSMTTLIDGLDDKAGKDYGASPDRLYLIGQDGKIAYQGGRGPRGFKPKKLEAAINEIVKKPSRSGDPIPGDSGAEEK